MKMDERSIASIMLCLQNCLLAEKDIVPMLQELDFTLSDGKLTCLNPPKVELSETADPILKKAFNSLSVEEEKLV